MTENSLEAFERAITLGVDMIEFDVRHTRDGELIVFHDAHVAHRPVAALSREELAGHTGHQPPLLEEVLELARGRVGLDVELKEAAHLDRLAELLRPGLAAGELVVTSFLDEVVAAIKRSCPQGRAGLLLGVHAKPLLRTLRSEIDPVPRARACQADFVAPHVSLAQLGALRHAADAGLPAYVWTVNETRAIERLLGDERVEAIITDVPARALELRARAHPGPTTGRPSTPA